MSSTIHEPTGTHRPSAKGPFFAGNDGGPGMGETSQRGVISAYSPHPVSTGIVVGLAAIAMTFAALTSAMVVRKGASLDWMHFTLPPVLYFNTGVIVLSSAVLEISRRSAAQFMLSHGQKNMVALQSLYATFLLGVLFVAGQCVGWMQLRQRGLYLPTNPSSSFFYVLTVAHAIHVLGGLGGLLLVIHRMRRVSLRKSTLDAVALYWHFVDLLWVYLLWLLWMKI